MVQQTVNSRPCGNHLTTATLIVGILEKLTEKCAAYASAFLTDKDQSWQTWIKAHCITNIKSRKSTAEEEKIIIPSRRQSNSRLHLCGVKSAQTPAADVLVKVIRRKRGRSAKSRKSFQRFLGLSGGCVYSQRLRTSHSAAQWLGLPKSRSAISSLLVQ